jgi:hypothetical protein
LLYARGGCWASAIWVTAIADNAVMTAIILVVLIDWLLEKSLVLNRIVARRRRNSLVFWSCGALPIWHAASLLLTTHGAQPVSLGQLQAGIA